jgi:hypothetical protein
MMHSLQCTFAHSVEDVSFEWYVAFVTGTYVQLLTALSISLVAYGFCQSRAPYKKAGDNLLASGLLLMTVSFLVRQQPS